MPIRYRVCSGPCGRSLPHTEFWKDSKQRDGRMTRCKDCVKEAREERAQRRANGEVVPTVSDELRKERSERAKQMHKQGRFGGAEFGRQGGLGRHRISDAVLDHFRGNPHLITQAIERALKSKSHGYRLRAAEMIVKLDQDEERIRQSARGAGKSPDEMSQEELEEFVTQGLRAMIERGEMDASFITLPDEAVREVA